MTRQEAETIYDKGKNYVVEVLMKMAEAIELLEKRILQLETEIMVSKAEIQELKRRINQNSSNSHKPPFSDGSKRPKRQHSLRRPNPGRKGGQKGHQGDTLRPSDNPDHVIPLSVSKCEHCQCDLNEVEGFVLEKRQVFDLPPLKLECNEYRQVAKTCPHCHQLNYTAFPEKVSAPTQYGVHVKSLCVYLNNYQFVPLQRLKEMFGDLFHHEISEGTLLQWNEQAWGQLIDFEAHLKAHLRLTKILHADETGTKLDGRTIWMHSWSTATETFYAPHAHRGKIAHQDYELLTEYKGVLVSDYFSSYFNLDCQHALCHAHHLRELQSIIENDEKYKSWAIDFQNWFLAAKDIADYFRNCGEQLPKSVFHGMEWFYDTLVDEGFSLGRLPPGEWLIKKGRPKHSRAQNLLYRFQKHKEACLAFLKDVDIPFDNNQAERDIRMVKLKSKISGSFRTPLGCVAFSRIRSYLSTIKKRSLTILEGIQEIFEGNPSKYAFET